MDQWFYSNSGVQHGPVTLNQLKDLIRQQAIPKNALVWTGTLHTWTPADQVPELCSAPPALPTNQSGRSAPQPLAIPKPPARRSTRLAFEDEISKAKPATAATPSPPPLTAPQGPPALPNRSAAQWYYEMQGKRVGPLDEGAMAALIRSGVVAGSTRVWHAALPDWTPAAQTSLVTHIPADQTPPLTPGIGPPVESPGGIYIERRDPLLVGVLSTVTLGLYAIYLVYLWSRELNALHRREKYPSVIVLISSILTLGFAGMLFECAYALDVDKLTKRFKVPDRAGNLGSIVILLNVIGWILVFASLGTLLIVGFLLCIAATCMLQRELNRLAECIGSIVEDHNRQQSPSTSSDSPAEPSASPVTRPQPLAAKRSAKTYLWGCGAGLLGFLLLSIAIAIPNYLRGRFRENESIAVASCRSYYKAQLEYANWDYDQDGQLEYAQRITGYDSLYESRSGAADRLLVSDGIANASRGVTDPLRKPFYGYYLKVLAGQGPSALRGPRNFIVGQNQVEGFALLAYPADYGETGKRSFIIGPDGTVYGKDLGAETPGSVEFINLYNPDSTWTQVYP